MKKNALLTLAVLTAFCFTGTAQAQTAAPATTTAAAAATPAKAPSAQQNKMKSCAAQYHQQNIPKNQYHSFMSTCLKGGSTTAAAPAATPAVATAPATAATPASTATTPAATQQDKMKACNKNAKSQSLTGDARKSFMKDCLSK